MAFVASTKSSPLTLTLEKCSASAWSTKAVNQTTNKPSTLHSFRFSLSSFWWWYQPVPHSDSSASSMSAFATQTTFQTRPNRSQRRRESFNVLLALVRSVLVSRVRLTLRYLHKVRYAGLALARAELLAPPTRPCCMPLVYGTIRRVAVPLPQAAGR